ncbi:hypothetical protein J6590_094654 [Homalodisca vitripennis]|nr:hypothetical protein J6590_053241 [Homalodisca vitripennis]KAG8243029.1 hypothetical protein J6590_053244 [Homalodisca vitripennis]KAG8269953.1 hypothetical protein J6590_095788 [Homalodisca vitripennis]KAG8284805.1 hypothetical protein J6590_094654 [Homalodisca vitripennis]
MWAGALHRSKDGFVLRVSPNLTTRVDSTYLPILRILDSTERRGVRAPKKWEELSGELGGK